MLSPMFKMPWSDAVLEALVRFIRKIGKSSFTRTEFHGQELQQICVATRTRGRTPHLTLDRVMQEFRDSGLIRFVDNNGTYQFLGGLVG